jgi:hypothetical protein
LQWSALPASAVTQIDIIGPPGSVKFGTSVTALPNGNFVVTDPNFNGGIAVDAGAVYLYNGATGALISTLTGISTGNKVGFSGVTVLNNGNYVIKSPYWDNSGAVDAGAVTWGNGSTGVSGVVSAANSLVGSMANDWVGSGGVIALSNGNYVVNSPYWDNPIIPDGGAVTWGSGQTGSIGAVNVGNSLVGSAANDMVGSNSVIALNNGNYVVCSPYWNNGATIDAGAATWRNGGSGVTGAVTVINSLVGNTAYDKVGSSAIALNNGNYVVSSHYWKNGASSQAGAATWGNGATGKVGDVSSGNSLVGSKDNDHVGTSLFALTNGNYVVNSPTWDLNGTTDVGAATWGNGTTGIVGPVSSSNSLVGSQANDQVGAYGVTALSNGNYVILSPLWNYGISTLVGAATWGNGANGTISVVSTANSLVGSNTNDQVGISVTALANGNYVVGSPYWKNNLASKAGAATWVSGASSYASVVSIANSLVGSQDNDRIGSLGVTALRNGNYVVASPLWSNSAATNAGAATWGDGASSTIGTVSATNSLVGGLANDYVGHYGVVALTDGNYVVPSPEWSDGGVTNAGAVTWGNGTTGISGSISSANSLVGSKSGDAVGFGFVTALNNGIYAVRSPLFDSSGGTSNAGAVTWGLDSSGIAGTITAQNSVIGTASGGGPFMVYDYDVINLQLVVGRPADNIVTLFRISSLYLPMIKK